VRAPANGVSSQGPRTARVGRGCFRDCRRCKGRALCAVAHRRPTLWTFPHLNTSASVLMTYVLVLFLNSTYSNIRIRALDTTRHKSVMQAIFFYNNIYLPGTSMHSRILSIYALIGHSHHEFCTRVPVISGDTHNNFV